MFQPIHITSRAIEERRIFDNDEDCFRFIFQLYTANIGKPVRNLWRQDVVKLATAILNGEEISSRFVIKEHDPLVNFLDFSLVKNHNHFYLLPNSEKSTPIFMRKLNNGFAQYFNLKYHRRGALFGGRYGRVIVKTQYQSDVVSRYVSIINPLDVFQPGWREDGLKDRQKALNFLENYQFSSFPDKIGKRKSLILAPDNILEKYLSIPYKNKSDYQESVKEFLKERLNVSHALFLE